MGDGDKGKDESLVALWKKIITLQAKITMGECSGMRNAYIPTINYFLIFRLKLKILNCIWLGQVLYKNYWTAQIPSFGPLKHC